MFASYIVRSWPTKISTVSGIACFILPSTNDWNDFGYRLMVEIRFINEKHEVLTFSRETKLYVEDQLKTSEFIGSLASDVVPIENGEIAGHKFISSLGTREHYESLLKFVGPDRLVPVLLSINDVSALRLEKSEMPSARLMDTEAFHQGLMRTSEAYFSFIGLSRLLTNVQTHGAESERRTRITFVESVSNEGSFFDIEFGQNELGRNLINAFIGPNGVGKTRLLRDLAATSLGVEPANAAENSVSEIQRVLRENRSFVTIFSHETSRWDDLAERDGRICSLSIIGESWTKLTSDLFDLVRSANADESAYSWNALVRVLGKHIPMKQLRFPRLGGTDYSWSEVSQGFYQSQLERSQQLDRSRSVLFRNDEGEAFELSSGQKLILTFITRLFISVQRNSLIIVDEPEIHLHPQYISLLMLVLHDALSANDSLAVIATHSPYVIRELDKAAVTVVKYSPEEGTYFARPTLQTRGGNLTAISNYVFEHSTSAPSLLTQQLDEFLMSQSENGRRSAVSLLSNAIGPDAQYYLIDRIKAV